MVNNEQWYNLNNFTYYVHSPILSIYPKNFSLITRRNIIISSMHLANFDNILCEFIGTDLEKQYVLSTYINSSYISYLV